MPTATKLISALVLAIAGAALGFLLTPLVPKISNANLIPIAAALGFVAGWVVIGRRIERKMGGAVLAGIAGVLTLVVWFLLVQGLRDMLRLAMDHRYHGPLEAIVDIIRLSTEYIPYFIRYDIGALLVAAALFSGVIAKITNRHWK